MKTTLTGSCHCESISYSFETDIAVNEIQVRACQCSFCRGHNALSISDPQGQVEIYISETIEPIKYKFGLKTCEFYICPICGNYIAAVFSSDDKLLSTVNASTLDESFKSRLQAAEACSYDNETRESRKARRLERWTPTIVKSKTLLEQMKIGTIEGFNDFVKQFQECTLSKNRWTHQAHFVVALWFILRQGYDSALESIRDGIKKYNEATGVPNTEHDGYHETTTILYLKLVQDFVADAKTDDEIVLLGDLLNSEIVDKEYPFKFYSKNRLMSKDARFNWLEPDLPV